MPSSTWKFIQTNCPTTQAQQRNNRQPCRRLDADVKCIQPHSCCREGDGTWLYRFLGDASALIITDAQRLLLPKALADLAQGGNNLRSLSRSHKYNRLHLLLPDPCHNKNCYTNHGQHTNAIEWTWLRKPNGTHPEKTQN